MFSQGPVTAHITHQHTDPCGRWCYQTFSCKNYIKLSVITAYQPCPSSNPDNTKKRMLTYHAQLTSELQTQGCYVTPWQAFITDLSELLQDVTITTSSCAVISTRSSPQ